MLKVKSISAHIILPLFLFITFAFLINNSASARQLTKEERKFYAQNNIIFTVPCDSEADCEPDNGAEPPDGDLAPPSGEGAELIVNFAIKSSWPTENGQCYDGSSYVDWKLLSRGVSPAGCKNTINNFAQNNGGTVQRLQDCGRFVGFVLRNTVDSSASYGGTYSQTDHFDALPSKWAKVSTDGRAFPAAQLEPGDILVYGDRNGGSSAGHILIYIGERTVRCGNSTCVVNTAEASIGGRTPNLYKLWNGTYMDRAHTKPYSVYRYNGG